MTKSIQIYYFSILKNESGLEEDTIQTTANTPSELYDELNQKHEFTLSKDNIRVAINEEFQEWTTVLKNDDVVVFIPPVSGG